MLNVNIVVDKVLLDRSVVGIIFIDCGFFFKIILWKKWRIMVIVSVFKNVGLRLKMGGLGCMIVFRLNLKKYFVINELNGMVILMKFMVIMSEVRNFLKLLIFSFVWYIFILN